MTEVRSSMAGTVFMISVEPGYVVQPGDVVVVLESMKMEIPIEAIEGGTVTEVRVQPGEVVQEDDVLLVLK